MRVLFVNLYIKVLSNNTFISVSDADNKVKWLKSMGTLGFRHRNKKIVEGFDMLVSNALNFLHEKNISINELQLAGFSYFRFRRLRSLLSNCCVKYCKIVEKRAFNGCRHKKVKRQKRKLKIKSYKRL